MSGTGAHHLLRWACGRISGGFILALHNLPAGLFCVHVEALAPGRPVPLSDLVERVRAGKDTSGLFAITFDDGVGDTVREIARTCETRQWPVTFYLPTGYLDDGSGMPFQWFRGVEPRLPRKVVHLSSRAVDLSRDESRRDFLKSVERSLHTQPREAYAPLIEELVACVLKEDPAAADAIRPPAPIGWDEVARLSRSEVIRFESHGVTHAALSGMPPDRLEQELKASRDAITQRTGRACRHFCYPFGSPESIGDRAPAVVERYYDSATTMVRGRIGGRRPALLPRIPLYDTDDADMVRLKVLSI